MQWCKNSNAVKLNFQYTKFSIFIQELNTRMPLAKHNCLMSIFSNLTISYFSNYNSRSDVLSTIIVFNLVLISNPPLEQLTSKLACHLKMLIFPALIKMRAIRAIRIARPFVFSKSCVVFPENRPRSCSRKLNELERKN